MISNTFRGLFWFVFPALCIVCNDCFAYLFGFFFGSTPLIDLSPKKTWEGFIGGALSTLVFSFIFTQSIMGSFPGLMGPLLCEQENIEFVNVTFPESCDTMVYLSTPKEYTLAFGIGTITLIPIQIHAFSIALFSSIVGPFGGFFASGFKRAFKIKDFGNTIPGHGGLMDRFDCQVMMGTFTFVYLSQVVFKYSAAERMFSNYMKMNPDSKILFMDAVI